jgi:hypothetical protein
MSDALSPIGVFAPGLMGALCCVGTGMATDWRLVSNVSRLTLCSVILMLWLRSSRRMATMPQSPRVDVVLYAFSAAQWPHLVYALTHIVGAIRDLACSSHCTGEWSSFASDIPQRTGDEGRRWTWRCDAMPL